MYLLNIQSFKKTFVTIIVFLLTFLVCIAPSVALAETYTGAMQVKKASQALAQGFKSGKLKPNPAAISLQALTVAIGMWNLPDARSPEDIVLDPTAGAGKNGRGYWETNGVSSTKSLTKQGSCDLAKISYGFGKVTLKGNICTGVWTNTGVSLDMQVNWNEYGDIWENPNSETVINDIVTQAQQGNSAALELLKVAFGLANPTMSETEINDLIEQLQKGAGATPTTGADAGTGTQAGTKDNTKDEAKEKETSKDLDLSETNSKLDKLAGSISQILQWLKDWTKDDSQKEKTELDIEQQTTPNINTNIKFNAQCPNDVIISGTWQGQTISFTFFEWSKYCDFLIYLKYIIIAMASYGAVKIVGGVNVSD